MVSRLRKMEKNRGRAIYLSEFLPYEIYSEVVEMAKKPSLFQTVYYGIHKWAMRGLCWDYNMKKPEKVQFS